MDTGRSRQLIHPVCIAIDQRILQISHVLLISLLCLFCFGINSHCFSAYYLPRSSLSTSVTLTQIPGKSSLCEWKGKATYWTLKNNATNEEVKGKIWSYEAPTQPFKDIKGYLSFYASGVPWECFVDDEKVQPQDGKF